MINTSVITDRVRETFLKGVKSFGEPDFCQADELSVLQLGYADETEVIVRVNNSELFDGEALLTLTAFEDDVIQLNLMLFGDCIDVENANAEADKYHMAEGDGFVWGFCEEFYPKDAMRMCTSFSYTDEQTMCSEIESRMKLLTDEAFVNKLKPITAYFK